MTTDEELTPFRDDPLLVALRAPAQEHELAGEAEALAMFRRSVPPRRRRRRGLTRATVGGAGILLGLGLTSGVAAAYTTGLPDPVQDVVHAAIDPLPIPAPPSAQLRHQRRVAAAVRRHIETERRAAARASAAASPRPSRAAVAPLAPDSGASPHARPTPTPASSSTPAPPEPTLVASVSQRTVPIHGQVLLSGRLTRGDAPVADHVVYAAELPAGGSTWQRVASGSTGANGYVSLTIPPLTGNVRLRLVAGPRVSSPQLPVFVVPKLTITRSRSADQVAVTVTADGGRPGDAVVLLRRDGDAWTSIGSTTLSSDATGRFVVPGPADTRVRYLVRLRATAQHAASVVEFIVPARSTATP
jgi:hypothetical protein